MRAPTNVMTNINTSDRASTLKEILAEKLPALIHCQRVTEQEPPNVGVVKKIIPVMIVKTAEIVTEPAPINAITERRRLLPNNARTRKPVRGNNGIKLINKFMHLFHFVFVIIFQFIQGISINRFIVMKHLKNQG